MAAPAANSRKLRFSLSEPRIGYTSGPLQIGADDDAFYAKGTYTEPLDTARTIQLNRTTNSFLTCYLQRLADPTKPWDATNNPYVIVDYMPSDLTTYNGESTYKDEDGNITVTSTANAFDTRRRDGPQNNLWVVDSDAPASGTLTAPLPTQSLGYLNRAFGEHPGTAMGGEGGQDYKGAPKNEPFPWLTFNNRPFNSQYELMLVPRTSCRELLFWYSLRRNINPYFSNYANTNADSEFTHLLNFFDSNRAPGTSPHYYRLLELTHVPSRFVGTHTWFNPQNFSGSAQGTELFHPPYNKVSNYRDPGKINLNTIYSRDVFMSLMKNYPSMATQNFWDKFVRSRQGVKQGAVPQPQDQPSIFGNPFRSYDMADQVPLDSMIVDGADTGFIAPRSGQSERRPIAPLFPDAV